MADTDLHDDDIDTAPEGDRVQGEGEQFDQENRLKPEFVRQVRDALYDEIEDSVYDLVEPLHPADIADLFELLERKERNDLAAAITDLMSSDVVAELNDYVREDMVEALPPEAVAEIVGQLDTDDAVQLIEDLDESDQRAILAEVEAGNRAVIETALAYPEETAGRLMQRELIAVPDSMSVGDLIDYLRAGEHLTTEFWEVFVVDHRFHPVGTIQLSWILRTSRSVCLLYTSPSPRDRQKSRMPSSA